MKAGRWRTDHGMPYINPYDATAHDSPIMDHSDVMRRWMEENAKKRRQDNQPIRVDGRTYAVGKP